MASNHQSPIGLPVRIASGTLGLGLLLLSATSLFIPEPSERTVWWLPGVFGCLFLAPAFASPVAPSDASLLASRRRKLFRVSRVVSALSLLGTVGVDSLVPESRRPAAEDPVLGPILLALGVIFVVAFLTAMYLAYKVSKSELASRSAV